jgi:serine/threonine protein kinase
LQQRGGLSVLRVLNILQGVCAAVDAAHQKRLLHRDLKPENIFLMNFEGVETAKILDFGLAKAMDPVDLTRRAGQTDPGTLIGTLKYMSPEELRGEKPAESWDLWALAVIAYEMMSGIHPIAASTAAEARDAILAARATPLSNHMPGAPKALQNFFETAFAVRAELRPASALHFFSEFKKSIQLIGRDTVA